VSAGFALRGAIRDAIGDVRGAAAISESDDGYRAHMSIGYVNAPGSATPIHDTVGLVSPEPAIVTVASASLIVLNRDDRIYRWHTRAEVALG